jgi:hypothetical protein
VVKKLKPRPLLLLPQHRSLHLLPLRLKPPSLLKLLRLLLQPRLLTLPSLLKLLQLRLQLRPKLPSLLKKRSNSSHSVKTGQSPRFFMPKIW